jgi:hypothetical protein
MSWEVQLIGESANLKMLSDSFTDPQLRMFNHDNDVMITSDNWDALLTAEEVREAADRAAAAISGASFLILGMTTPLKAGSVHKVEEDGTRHITMFCNSGEFRVRTFPVTITAGGVTHYPADPVSEYYEVASKIPAVERALSLRCMDRPDWVRLYILYEIVQDDVGDLMHTAGWVSKAEIKRFTHTANSPSVTGSKSRHGVERTPPPKNPMSIPDALKLIDSLLHNWIKSKQGN